MNISRSSLYLNRSQLNLHWCTLVRQFNAGWWLALWLLVTLRIGLELVAIFSLHLDDLPRLMEGEGLNLVIHGGDLWSEFLSIWQRWDANWYQQIATNGYVANDGTLAFYPLYPLLARMASTFLGGQIVLAELIVSSAAFLVATGVL